MTNTPTSIKTKHLNSENKNWVHLEQLMMLPIYDFKSVKGKPSTSLQHDKEPVTEFGIIIHVATHGNPLTKFSALFKAVIRLHFLKKKMTREFILETYGVYPTPDEPVALYSLGTQAESYVNAHVIPGSSDGLNGRLRNFIQKVVKFNPSLGAVILVARKR